MHLVAARAANVKASARTHGAARFGRRTLATVLGAGLAVSVVAGCGSDSDEASPGEQFCTAGAFAPTCRRWRASTSSRAVPTV
jgi:hypothetical protein